jgi:general secretion pathway protein K
LIAVTNRRQQGFVLILTLCILAAITIVAAYFGQRVQQSLQLAQLRQVMTDQQIAINNTRSEILYRLSTTYLSLYGLGPSGAEVALDDRPYSNEGTTVQIQDSRGLININSATDAQLQNFLGAMQVPVDQRAHLIDTLRDYIDADDLRRLDGAESDDYAALGLPPPRNLPLFSPIELKNIIGWRDMPSLWQDPAVTELVGVGGLPTINPNTAPWQVLAALPGVTPEIAKLIVARRKLGPISVALLDQLAGVNLDTFPPTVTTYPSDHLRVTQRAIGMPWAIRYNVRLTPDSQTAPWQINYYYRVEEKAGPVNANIAVNGSEIPKLPPRSIVPTAQAIILPF